MLIACERHTKKDLELWKEFEESDFIHYELNKKKFECKIEKAISDIRTWYKEGYLGVSWGKDSVVTAHLVILSEVQIPFVWIKINPIYNPYCLHVRDEFLKKYNTHYEEIEVDCTYSNNEVHATGSLEKGFKEVSKKYSSKYISGVRKSESGIRLISRIRHGVSTENVSRPIIDWSEQDVFSYLAYNDLPIHPSYAMLGGGKYNRQYLRVASLGGKRGDGFDRAVWEKEYYPDILRKIETLGRARNKIE